jgi:hypothetical protein
LLGALAFVVPGGVTFLLGFIAVTLGAFCFNREKIGPSIDSIVCKGA